MLDRCRDHRRLMICQKQHRQNDLAGKVDVPTREEVHVTGDSRTHVETTNLSPPVKNNTDRMNQLVR